MAGVVRIGDGSGGCCDCAQQVGCDCSAVPCARVCRSKSGTAELCGREEFTDPSEPPKKYHKRELKSEGGRFVVCSIPFPDCELSDCQGSVRLEFSGTISGSPTITASGTFRLLGVTAGMATYRAEDLSGVEAPASPIGVRLRFEISAVEHLLNEGDEVDVPEGTEFDVCLQVNYIAWSNAQCLCVVAGKPLERRTADDWDLVQEYAPAACVAVPPADATCPMSETDLSTRRSKVGSGCADDGTGEIDALPSPDPAVAYAGGVNVDEGKTLRTYEGLGCIDQGDGTTINYLGRITDTLSVEDTEEAAEARVTACMEWLGGSCGDHTAFRTTRGTAEFGFGFRAAQVQVTAGSVAKPLIIGHDYRVTLRYGRRVLGSGGAYVFHAAEEIEFTADTAPTDTTAWIDIPNEAGWETAVIGCSVEDIT